MKRLNFDFFIHPEMYDVSTTQGAYGYRLRNGDECLLADTPGEFSEACLSLMEDPASGREIAERGRSMFERELDWNAIAPRVVAAVNACLELRPRIQAGA